MTTKENERPQVGDRVKMNCPGSWIDGYEYTIVEPPSWARDDQEKWIYAIDQDDPNDTVGSIFIADCVIVSRGNRVMVTDIDASLDKQRDDNLKHLFGYDT